MNGDDDERIRFARLSGSVVRRGAVYPTFRRCDGVRHGGKSILIDNEFYSKRFSRERPWIPRSTARNTTARTI